MSDKFSHEERLQRANSLLSIIGRAQSRIIAHEDAHQMFQEMLKDLLELTNSQFGFIGESFERDGKPYLKTYALTNIAWDDESREFYSKHAPEGLEFHNLETLFGAVLLTGKPVVSNNPADDPRSGGTPYGHPKLEAFLGLPFNNGDDLVGMVGVANCPEGYDQDTVEYLTPMLSACGQMIRALRVSREQHATGKLLSNKTAQIELKAQELVALNQRLALSNGELAQFAYVASHDLQEPLRKITSFCQMLKQDYGGQIDEVGNSYIDFAVNGAKRMRSLINDLLEYSQLDSRAKPLELTSVEASLQRALENLEHVICERSAEITSDPLPEFMADDSHLSQLFQNLISNAIKYCQNEPPRVHVGVFEEEDVYKLSVRDNGIGIDSRFFDRVFVIFQRLHSRSEYSGTGIGLTICKKIVERMGGRIWVESELGEGATFFFTAPKMTTERLVQGDALSPAGVPVLPDLSTVDSV